MLRNCFHLSLTKFLLIPAALTSSRVNPRPSLCFRLYLKVGHRTTGLRVLRGLGAILAALATRALRRRSLRAGWLNQVLTYRSQSLWKCPLGTIWFRLAGIFEELFHRLEEKQALMSEERVTQILKNIPPEQNLSLD